MALGAPNTTYEANYSGRFRPLSAPPGRANPSTNPVSINITSIHPTNTPTFKPDANTSNILFNIYSAETMKTGLVHTNTTTKTVKQSLLFPHLLLAPTFVGPQQQNRSLQPSFLPNHSSHHNLQSMMTQNGRLSSFPKPSLTATLNSEELWSIDQQEFDLSSPVVKLFETQTHSSFINQTSEDISPNVLPHLQSIRSASSFSSLPSFFGPDKPLSSSPQTLAEQRCNQADTLSQTTSETESRHFLLSETLFQSQCDFVPNKGDAQPLSEALPESSETLCNDAHSSPQVVLDTHKTGKDHEGPTHDCNCVLF